LWIAELSTFCWFSTIFFLSYYLFEFADFFFQDTYNTWLKKRYNDDSMTHPDLNLDLLLETTSFSGPDKNQIYVQPL
jgi:hypothetical protein